MRSSCKERKGRKEEHNKRVSSVVPSLPASLPLPLPDHDPVTKAVRYRECTHHSLLEHRKQASQDVILILWSKVREVDSLASVAVSDELGVDIEKRRGGRLEGGIRTAIGVKTKGGWMLKSARGTKQETQEKGRKAS